VNWFNQLFSKEEVPTFVPRERAIAKLVTEPHLKGLPYGIGYESKEKTEIIFIHPGHRAQRVWLLWVEGTYTFVAGSATEEELNLIVGRMQGVQSVKRFK
jgi:hypothetical protein